MCSFRHFLRAVRLADRGCRGRCLLEGEGWLPGQHFIGDAAQRPHVHLRAVGSIDQLGGKVFLREGQVGGGGKADLGTPEFGAGVVFLPLHRVLCVVPSHSDGADGRQSEICDLDF
jgi:hypothetical protein